MPSIRTGLWRDVWDARRRRHRDALAAAAIGPIDWLRRIAGRSPRSSTRITQVDVSSTPAITHLEYRLTR
jgi:hypothetical protein